MSDLPKRVESDVEAIINDSLEEMVQEYNQFTPTVRVYLFATVGLSIATWDITFNLGVYDTIFFSKLFFLWVACTATVLAVQFLEKDDRNFDNITRVALLIPTVWLVTVALLPVTDGDSSDWMEIWLFVVQLATLISLPYLAFTLLLLTQPDTFTLPRRMRFGLVVVVFIIGVLGYLIGSNHPHFLSCRNFEVSGNAVPANCAE